MSDTEDVTVRKTRSGRAIKPAKAKATARKTRKKVVVMEVEVTDDEETESPLEGSPSKKKFKPNASEEDILLSDTSDKLTDASSYIIEKPGQNSEILEEEVDIDNQVLTAGEENDVELDNTNNVDKVTSKNDVNGRHAKMDTSGIVEENSDIEEMDENALLGEEAEHEANYIEDTPVTAERVLNEQILEETSYDEHQVDPETASYEPLEQPEAENISDDELPGVVLVKVPETEEVSDEELPGPKRAELPADTEVVSEDEFPSSKKDPEDDTSMEPNSEDDAKKKATEGDYDPTSPTSESEVPIKKSKEDKEEKEKEGNEHKPKPKKLPELDKYWKAVNDDPTDFTGWTYLLQYVDQENDMEAAREAYDAFLSHYPYCYGYWRKYTDYEKRKGNKKKCEEVFERGLKAIPLSVDLWIHYLTYVKTTRSEDEDYIRSQFERALIACGLEFRSDRLWDSYIKWETEAKRLQRVTRIYDRLLATPTQSYNTHFDNFQEHVASNPPNKVVDVDEFLALRKEVRNILKHDSVENATENADVPPGDEDSKLCSTDEETKAIRERIISIRRKIHKNTVASVTARWNFEEGIKRPYFHVKPLERCQLKNWQDYIDYEIEQGDNVRIVVLFERCLIACALYDEYWLKFVHYLEGLKDPEQRPKIRDVYERACTIHHLKKPNLHLQWALFEESCGNVNRAAEILVNLEKQVPNVLQVAYRRINLERRRSDYEKCSQLFEHYVANFKNKTVCSNISLKYSRFALRILKDYNKAHEIIKSAITKDPNNPRLYLQLIDLTLQSGEGGEDDICSIINEFLEKDNIESEQKVLFAQRKLEFLEDFGSKVEMVQAAYEDYQKYIKQSKDNAKKKDNRSDAAPASGKKEKSGSSASQVNSYGNYNYGSGGPSNPSSYPYPAGSQQGQYNYSQYGQGEQYQYQNWQYPQGGYGGYNQWGGYGGSYGY